MAGDDPEPDTFITLRGFQSAPCILEVRSEVVLSGTFDALKFVSLFLNIGIF